MPLTEERYQYHKDYAKTEKGQASFNKARIKWRLKNKVKNAAAQSVRNAVSRGKIVKPLVCQGCKTEARLHGHHDNYFYPLEVKWLCDT